MSTQTVAAINATVKEILIPNMQEAHEKKAVTWNRINQGEDGEINARGTYLSILSQDHAIERTSTVEGQAFPEESAPEYVKAHLPHIRVERTIGFTGSVKRNDNKGHLNVKVVRRNFLNTMAKVMKSMNRFTFGDGSGELARVGAGTIGAGGTAVDTTTKKIFCNGTTNLYGVRFIDKGATLEARSTGGVARTSGGGSAVKMTVTEVNRDKNQMWFKVDVLPTDIGNGDLIVNYQSYGTAPFGFDYHTQKSGDWLGLTRGSTNPGLNSVRRSNGGDKLTGGALDQLLGDIEFKLGDEPNKDGMELIWSPTQRNSYLDEGYKLKRFMQCVGMTSKGEKVDMGFETVTHAGMVARVDVDCQIDRVIPHKIGVMKKYELFKIQVLQDGGGPIRPKVGADGYYDSFVGFIQGEFNLAAPSPWELAMLTDCSTEGYSNGHQA